jgi:NTE family protein
VGCLDGAAVVHAGIELVALMQNAPITNLALQGGGSHGAFTWGVLDALLEDGRVAIEGISGTSAGAMNAVALAHGFALAQSKSTSKSKTDPREAARASLANFWDGIVSMGTVGNMLEAQRAPFDMLMGSLGGDASAVGQMMASMTNMWSTAMTQSMSPYQNNPLDINPLKEFLEKNIDFEAIAALTDIKLFVVATGVSTGKAEVFSGKRITSKAVMASACLPTLFKAIEIEGEHYWDGGYSGNPAIHPLIYKCSSRDILLVQINPIKRDKLPTTAAEIMDRMNEITFNAGLLAEMRAIDFVKRLIAQGKLDANQYKDVLMHRIDGGELLEQYNAASKVSTNRQMIHKLRDLGRACTKKWLKQHIDQIGKQATVNIARDYLDDLRVPIKTIDD